MNDQEFHSREGRIVRRRDLERRFAYHKPTEEKALDHTHVRNNLANTAAILNNVLPNVPEREIALMKLEECMFWSNAAIAREGK